MSKQKSLTAPGSVAEEVLTDAPESRFGDIRPIDCDGREQQARNLALVVGDRVGNSDEISSALESATAPWRPPRLNPKVLVHGHGLWSPRRMCSIAASLASCPVTTTLPLGLRAFSAAMTLARACRLSR
jgi:hypothetical protein